MFAAAIFDMDGLLIDSERPIMAAWIEVARTLGIELSHSQYMQVVGLSTVESEVVLASLLGGAAAYTHAVGLVRQRLQLERSDGTPLFPIKSGAAEMLAALRERGTRCAVASSSTSAQIQACLGSLGVDPADCIAFEDSENGAKAALAAGLRVVVVPDLKHPPASIAEQAFHVLDSLHDALAHLSRWFPQQAMQKV
ncbi:HAD family phosphatase [uncultured Variovorax sp.]|uniref:HAD family hydrolase n=1 Tax=uncultured Variovorax sp. TaxID=114708 RepID=UPI0025F4FF7A|nr:HAD family phosphatase [uncultured Variovorax sp.]